MSLTLNLNTNHRLESETRNSEIDEARITVIGRIFTLGGSVFFLIGSLIAVIVGYKTYTRLINDTPE